MTYVEKVAFLTPDIEESTGLIKNLNDVGVILRTHEKLAVNSKIEIDLTLKMGNNPVHCNVEGKIMSSMPDPEGVFQAYRIIFDRNMTQATRNMLKNLETKDEAGPAPKSRLSNLPSGKEASGKTGSKGRSVEALLDESAASLEKEKVRIASGSNLKILGGILGVVLVIFLLHFLYQSWDRQSFFSDLPKELKITTYQINSATVTAQVSPGWLESTSREQKMNHLQQLAELAHRKNLDGVDLVDQRGKLLARVMLMVGGSAQSAKIKLYTD